MTDTDTAPDEAQPDEADNLTRNGAEALAARLTAYWLAQGQGHTTARFWVEPGRYNGSNSGVFVVRSNLVRGHPPRIPGLASCR